MDIVFTFVGKDKPGLVKTFSATVREHQGNWQESRMSKLSGQFAGIARITVADAEAEQMIAALRALAQQDLHVHVEKGVPSQSNSTKTTQINLIGNDRPGIVAEISLALSNRDINVVELSSNMSSAPMTAEALFSAEVSIEYPETLDFSELQNRLEEIANDLGVDITIE